MSDHHYDLLIVGGGLVGASLARALAPLPLRIGLIDQQALAQRSKPGFDVRAIALSWGSRCILDGLGLWPDIAASACPIRDIHVSDRGHFGISRLHAADYGVDALGYVCEARDIGAALAAQLPDQANLDLYLPASVSHVDIEPDRVRIGIDGEAGSSELSASLVVAADGRESALRDAFDIPVRRWDYAQTAIAATVQPQRPHQHVAYERFTDSGPMALLPLPNGRCSLVWTVASDAADELLALSDQQFLARLGERFGSRLGRFERVGQRGAFPLSQVVARDGVSGRLALIGNAAHTLHPVAGQGFNLGLRDIATLAEVLADALLTTPTDANGANGVNGVNDPTRCDLGDPRHLQRYQQWRQRDQQQVALFTDGLARLFSNPLAPVALLRNIALTALDFNPPLKRRFARSAMGIAGTQPRLALGLPLCPSYAQARLAPAAATSAAPASQPPA